MLRKFQYYWIFEVSFINIKSHLEPVLYIFFLKIDGQFSRWNMLAYSRMYMHWSSAWVKAQISKILNFRNSNHKTWSIPIKYLQIQV